jgi:futalosine hydrolase
MNHLLLVAATAGELCGHPGVACGIGPVEAAAGTARAVAERAPKAVLHVGIAGGRGLPLGTLVVGSRSVYSDLAAGISVVDVVEPHPRLLAAACSAIGDAVVLPIETSAGLARSSAEGLVEAMEGFGVLRACGLAGVPAIEVRAISNEIGEADRALWDIPGALEALAQALPRLIASLTADESISP